MTNGPVAIAGSNSILYNKMGIKDATAHPMSIDKKIETPTVIPKIVAIGPCNAIKVEDREV